MVSAVRSATPTLREPWSLVGPWYRWADPYDPDSGRGSQPVFQKYDSPKLVAQFLANPQRSLAFTDEDLYHELRQGLWTRTDLRKIYLDTHRRFYLVVCELHCDSAGFPSPRRGEVCEAGFVVRRRTVRVPPELQKTVGVAYGQLVAHQARLAHLEALPEQSRSKGVKKAAEKARAELFIAEAQLSELARAHGLAVELEGWIPSEFDGLGRWQLVEDRPQVIAERVHPLQPLVADPAIEDHKGAGRALYFGLLPTGSADTDRAGYARFDDKSLYEVRCFVRRRKYDCALKNPRGRCKGEVVWSAPTRPYRLASHFDLLGTSNRPINVQLPDLPALKAELDRVPIGRRAPVRMIAPKDSGLDFSVDTDEMTATKKGFSAQICCFAIPLITIVATFVLKLFLPIVIFVFQLWWMLRLKFCIPPSIGIDAGLAAQLSLDPGGVELQADLKLAAQASAMFSGPAATIDVDEQGVTLTAEAKADMVLDFSADFSASTPPGIDLEAHPDSGGNIHELPDLEASLAYEAEVPLP